MSKDESQDQNENDDESREAWKNSFRHFFAEVGYAITRWANVDRALFNLTRFALGTTDEKTAIVFYRAYQIGDHLALADKLLHLSLGRKRLLKWKSIHEGLIKALPFRNDIAHNTPAHTVVLRAAWPRHATDEDLKQTDFEASPAKQW